MQYLEQRTWPLILYRAGKIGYKLYLDLICASYVGYEVAALLRRTSLAGARIHFQERSRLGFVRGGQGAGRGTAGRT